MKENYLDSVFWFKENHIYFKMELSFWIHSILLFGVLVGTTVTLFFMYIDHIVVYASIVLLTLSWIVFLYTFIKNTRTYYLFLKFMPDRIIYDS